MRGEDGIPAKTPGVANQPMCQGITAGVWLPRRGADCQVCVALTFDPGLAAWENAGVSPPGPQK